MNKRGGRKMEWISALYTLRITLECVGVLHCAVGSAQQLAPPPGGLRTLLRGMYHGIIG